MMNYRRNRKKNSYIWLPVLFIILAGVFTLTPVVRITFDGLEGLFLTKLENGEEIKGVFSSMFFARKNIDKFNELKAEKEKLEIDLLKFEDERSELEELRNIFNLDHDKNKIEIKRIIMRPPWSGFDILVLEKGNTSNSSVGDLVTIYGNVALGRVVEILDKTIRVELFTKYNNKMLAFVSPQNLEQEIIGRGGSNFELNIPRDIAIEEGDRVYMGKSSNYLLGVVKVVIFDPRDPYKTVLVTPPVNMSDIHFVEIEI